MALKFLKPEYLKKQFDLAEAVSVSFAFVTDDKGERCSFAATHEEEPPALMAKLKKDSGLDKGVAGTLRVVDNTLRLTPIKSFPGLRKAVTALAKAEGWKIRKTRVEGEPEVVEVPTRTSEVISGASGAMTSIGGLTNTTAALGEDFGKGARENAYFNMTGDQGDRLGPRGSAPMQSPRAKAGRTFARRHGLGFLCWDYQTANLPDLADVKEYQTPNSAYLRAFKGMDKSEQIENPTARDMLNHIERSIRDLAAYAFTTPGHESEWGELVVSFQGHGDRGEVFGVDGSSIKASKLLEYADLAESMQVSLTLVLDGCFTGRAVEEFQNRSARVAEKCIAAAEVAGASAASLAEWKRKAAVARRMIKFSRVLGKFTDQMRENAIAMEVAEKRGQPEELKRHLGRAGNTVKDAVKLLSAMSDLLDGELASPLPGGPDLHALSAAFAAKIKLCASLTPRDLKSFEHWMGEIGHLQDRISDTANILLETVDREARAAANKD
jgi:hypothetical protein